MAQFYDQLAQAVDSGEPFALGIISGIKGSSPQKKGAKALFFADGRIVGTLGGGCLEAEIQDRARRALLTKQPATFDLVLDHDFGWDDGLICGGKVSGVILPRAAEAADLWRELTRREQMRTWGVRKDFSITWADSARVEKEKGRGERAMSSVGPHLVPHTARFVSSELLANPSLTNSPLTQEAEWLYRETVFPPSAFWIAGSGHVAQAVAPLALQLDFDVTVFDDRPTFASRQFFPENTKFRVGAWEQLFAEQLPDKPAFGLIVTRGHQRDALVLADWIHRPFAFLGMIGSRRKARLIFDQFLEGKLATPDEIARVACPVGVEIQSQTVPEIAVSIMAQFIQKRAEALNP